MMTKPSFARSTALSRTPRTASCAAPRSHVCAVKLFDAKANQTLYMPASELALQRRPSTWFVCFFKIQVGDGAKEALTFVLRSMWYVY